MSQHAARKILVTGAGGGLGRSIAEHLARSGDQVIGTVRDPARAADLTASAQAAGLDLRFAALELTSDEALASLADELNAGGGVDVLVHNAGFGIFGAVEDVDEYRRRSPVFWASKLKTPLLVHATTNDRDVNVLEAENLIAALKAAGKDFEHKIYTDAPAGHSFNRIDTRLAKESRKEIWAFLRKHLGR